MKIVKYTDIVSKTAVLIDKCLKNVEKEAVCALQNMLKEGAGNAWALKQITDNARIAAETDSYACQDTGLAVFFLEMGNNVFVEGGLITDAINEGVRLGYKDARKSVADPITRLNTLDNTPAIIHVIPVKGDNIKITYLAKGAGSENMSHIYMLTPSKGKDGILNSITDCISRAGANPCPPIIAGVGVGGDFEKCAILAKFALTRPTGKLSDNPEIAGLEKEALARLNSLNIGAAGLGGKSTAMSVAIETFPTHIGMLPVAVNIQCHSVRHGTIII